MIKETLSTHLNNLRFAASSNNNSITLSKLKKYRVAINALEEVGVFPKQIETLKESDIFTTASDQLTIETDDYYRITHYNDQIILGSQGLITLLDQSFGVDVDNMVLLKLPETEDLKVIIETLSKFEKVLSLTILHPDIRGDIKVEGVQPGSIWFKICVNSTAAVALI